jgi:hypothetical protein
VLLGFSRGKDSIAAWLWLRHFARRIIPFHCAGVPHLAFQDESLAYYERFFGTPIERCVSGAFTGSLAKLIYQPCEDEEAIDELSLWEFDNLEVARLVAAKHGCPDAWTAFGINVGDSIDRRIYVKKYGGHNEARRTCYPCFDWPRGMIMRAIEESGVKLPGDYRMANRSMAGIRNMRHLALMESLYPEDFARVELWFPLIRARMARDQFRPPPAPKSTTRTAPRSRREPSTAKAGRGKGKVPRGARDRGSSRAGRKCTAADPGTGGGPAREK